MSANVAAFIAAATAIIIIGLLIRNSAGTASVINATGGQTQGILSVLEFNQVSQRGSH